MVTHFSRFQVSDNYARDCDPEYMAAEFQTFRLGQSLHPVIVHMMSTGYGALCACTLPSMLVTLLQRLKNPTVGNLYLRRLVLRSLVLETGSNSHLWSAQQDQYRFCRLGLMAEILLGGLVTHFHCMRVSRLHARCSETYRPSYELPGA